MRLLALRGVVLSALSLTVSCGRAGIPLGSVEQDNVALAASALFAHYQGLLTGATTVGELLRNPLSFSAKPTPRALLQQIAASNPPAAADAVPLRVLSYNVGLLDVQLFGLVNYARTPDLEVRAAVMAQTLFAQGYDVIAVQELWRSSDVTRFRAAAATAGYWVVTSSRAGYTDGLAIAVKTSVAPTPGVVLAEQYSEISGNEFYPANGYSRGFLSVRFESPALGPVVVYDTHTAAFPSAYRLRMAHARELGLHARRNVTDNALLFVMGDLNAAPYYATDRWALANGTSEPDWFANTLSYPVMMHYAGVTDLAVRARSMADADADITLGDLVPSNPAMALQVPLGDAGYCARTPNTVFTGTDCNAMYFAQYAGTEFPARLDYVLARDTDNRIHVAESTVAFVDPVPYSDGRMGPLSDHYGQAVRLQIAPRR
ncbi:MAG: endonuclease/exonuclease/phosphatase family protein [Deltaproteobacteria bacterium]|nr:endonuclease/exonuclease/phosphatase family protein [Deltaproteobacteria bacterium]